MNMHECAVCGVTRPTVRGRANHERLAHPSWTAPPDLRRHRRQLKNNRWKNEQPRSWRFLVHANDTARRRGLPRLPLDTVLPDGPCAYCGGYADGWDHVVPFARGGSHTVANLVPACLHCNHVKSARPAEVMGGEYLAGVAQETGRTGT